METTLPRWVPARITPPVRQPSGLAFVATFVRNPLQVVPQAAYEEDFVAGGEGGVARAWVTSPAFIKAVLLDEREKFRKLAQIRLLKPLLGKGILTSEGAEWKWQRQTSAPMFRPAELAGYVPAFVAAAERTLARWRAAPPGTVTSVDDDMTHLTFDVVCATLLPTSDPALASPIQDSVRGFQDSGGWQILFAALGLPNWMPRPGMRRGREAVSTLRAAVTAMIRERDEGKQVDTLMQRLIVARDPETGRAMSEEQLVDNLLTFYLAGHETTAKALTWTLYLLSRSPQWTAALVEEVERVTQGAPVAAAHVEKLSLVQQVLKESMRLYPPVPMMSRQAVADVQLGRHAVKAGTSILMPMYTIHRHAQRWDDPDAFDPTRFTPEKEAAMHRYQYMPFGAGPRICIGMSFALIEATAILATLLRGVRVEPADDTEPVPVARVTLIARGGMRLKVFHKEREFFS